MDCPGRERQQYSGEVGHQHHSLRYAFGETRLSKRYLRTFSQGLTMDDYFLDCWPAWDRLARLSQRQLGITNWGPILDHGVGFIFNNWSHYLETADLDAIQEPYPRLLRFADYLLRLRDEKGNNGLLPVENFGVPCVWMDHDPYQMQRHKQCPFNLYVAAMLQYALAPLAKLQGEPEKANRCLAEGRKIVSAVVRNFWSSKRGAFVDNLPWLGQENNAPRMSDRSLGMAILFDQCPDGKVKAVSDIMANCPSELGLSHPANACWRYWALGKLGRGNVVLNDLRRRWATMQSVKLNNTLQEFWSVGTGDRSEWSHCPVVPTATLFMTIAGILPAAPGFEKCTIRPQLGDLNELELTAYTVRGPIKMAARKKIDAHQVILNIPSGINAELLLPATAGDNTSKVPSRLLPDHPLGLRRFKLQTGRTEFFTG